MKQRWRGSRGRVHERARHDVPRAATRRWVLCFAALAVGVLALAGCEPDAPAQLPPWLSYCSESTCGGLETLVVKVCPDANPGCTPRRSTTIRPTVDARQINGVFFPIDRPEGYTAARVSGSGDVQAGYVTARTGTIVVRSDADVTISYYGITPIWNGTTTLEFVSLTTDAPEATTTVFRHRSYLTAGEPQELASRSQTIVRQQRSLARIDPGKVQAIFVPTELVLEGEGNFSYGDRPIVTINYGNPAWIASQGSVYASALPRFAHEDTHQLFSTVRASFPGNPDAFNEGIADALPFAAGNLPEDEFGPIGLRGASFDEGCAGITADWEIHDAGNCPLWQVKRLGKLTTGFTANLLHPKTIISYDSGDLTSARTGNALIVQYSDAAGEDLSAAIAMAKIPNAGSYQAARAALGL